MLVKLAKQISTSYLSDLESDPTQMLAKIAQDNNLNAREIERVANRANRQIIVGLQKMAVSQNVHDPHFTFPTIKTANVVKVIRLGGGAPEIKSPTQIMPSLESVIPAGRHQMPEYTMDSFVSGEKEPVNKEIAIKVLEIMKLKAKECKQRMIRKEIMIDQMIERLSKHASHHLIQGAPIQVFDNFPSYDIIEQTVEKVASFGVKIERTEDEFLVDQEHPAYKLASQIEEMRKEIEDLAEEKHMLDQKVQEAKDKVNAFN